MTSLLVGLKYNIIIIFLFKNNKIVSEEIEEIEDEIRDNRKEFAYGTHRYDILYCIMITYCISG